MSPSDTQPVESVPSLDPKKVQQAGCGCGCVLIVLGVLLLLWALSGFRC